MATGSNPASEPRWLALFNPDVRGKLLNSEEELVAALDNPDVRGLVTFEMLRRAGLSLGTIARSSSHFEHKFEASEQGDRSGAGADDRSGAGADESHPNRAQEPNLGQPPPSASGASAAKRGEYRSDFEDLPRLPWLEKVAACSMIAIGLRTPPLPGLPQNSPDCERLFAALRVQYRNLNPTEPEVDNMCNIMAVDIAYAFGFHPSKKHFNHFGDKMKSWFPSIPWETVFKKNKQTKRSKYSTRFALKVSCS